MPHGEETQASLRELVPLALPPAHARFPWVLPHKLQLDEQGVKLALDDPLTLAFGMQQRKQIWQAQMRMANQQGQDGFLLPREGQVQQRSHAQASGLVSVEFFGEHRWDAWAILSPRSLYLAPGLLLQRFADVARKPLRGA